MPNPKRKHTSRRRDTRRMQNWKIEDTGLNKCPNCGASRQPHHVCKACGFYNSELIVPRKVKKKKTEHEEQNPQQEEQK